MYNLVSLWDSAYSLKGRTLINSLVAACGDNFKLYVIAMDGKSADEIPIIPQVTVIPLGWVEDAQLKQLKKERSTAEYCWTLTPESMRHVFEQYEPDSLAYIDADTFFFREPSQLYAEVENASVAAIPHRFKPGSPEETRCIPNGIYNVNWVFARNNSDGRKFVNHWAALCREWCFYKNENGKFADQGYLNFLIGEYCGITVQHLGANLAPWNQAQYNYSVENDGFYISNETRSDPLIFYHFHELSHDSDGNVTRLTFWPVHSVIENYVYGTYAKWLQITAKVKNG